MSECANCGLALQGRYCYSCGQRDVDLARPFVELAADVLRESLDVDGRAWRTLRALFARPGLLTREFLAGRRVTYTPPLRLYIVTSVAFFLAMTWAASRGLLLDPQQTLAIDAEAQAVFVSGRLPRMMFLLMPVFAVLLKAVYWRRNYFDHLIFSLHLHCAAYVMFALALPLERATDQNLPALLAQLAVLSYFLVYLLLAMRRVYESGWLQTLAKMIAIVFAYLIIVSVSIESASDFLIIQD